MMQLAQAIGRLIDFFYVRPFSSVLSKQMFRYAACGGGNMLLDLVWYFVVYHYVVAERYIDLGIIVMSPHVASLVVVFPITFLTGFWLNRNVAFCATQAVSGPRRMTRESMRFIISRFAILYPYIVRGCTKCW